jgi:PAS domain S-box-containing protein
MTALPSEQPRLVDRLEWLASQIETGVIITDADGRVQWVNDGFTRMSGFSLPELMGRKPGALLQGPDTDPAAVERMRAAVREHRSFMVEVLNYARNGTPYWVHIDCHPMRGADGRLEGFMALEIDITERQHARASLLESEARYRSLFEHAHEAILIADDSGRYVDANPAAVRLLGYPIEALRSMSVADITAPETATRRWEAFEREGVQRGEIDLRARDGTVRTMEYNAVANFRPGLHLSMLRDVTGRRQAELRARRSDRLEALGTLAGGIAHDFNNILTGMLGQLEVVRHELQADTPVLASLDAIADGGKRARDLIQRILAFSRLHEPVREPIAIANVVAEAVHLLRSLLPAMVELRFVAEADCPLVAGDATALHQVVLNLCTNAWHALPPSGGCIEVHVEHRAARPNDPELAPMSDGPVVRILVRDNGHGMDDAVLARIFEPLFTTKPVGEGTGLGLAGVQAIITGLGGVVQVRSARNAGSTFTVWLPALHARDLPRPPAEPTPLPRGEGARIVLADDDPQTRSALERMLRHLGYTVESYEDPREALARLTASPQSVELLVSDLAMPSMSGDVLARSCRAVRANLPILILSGYLTDDVRAQLTASGIGTLDKPPSLRALADALSALIETRAT